MRLHSCASYQKRTSSTSSSCEVGHTRALPLITNVRVLGSARPTSWNSLSSYATVVKLGTKSYITGGLKMTCATTKALKVVDGLGLARTGCQEPNLFKDILSGRVKGALQQLLDENNFTAVNINAAGTQIRQLGKDHAPIDLFKRENLEGFMKDLTVWSQAMSENVDGVLYGYPDMEIAPPVPNCVGAA